VLWKFFPDTRRMPLEEVAALFGDADEVAVYQRDIAILAGTHELGILDQVKGEEKMELTQTENVREYDRCSGGPG
jgi:hypothetical protein